MLSTVLYVEIINNISHMKNKFVGKNREVKAGIESVNLGR